MSVCPLKAKASSPRHALIALSIFGLAFSVPLHAKTAKTPRSQVAPKPVVAAPTVAPSSVVLSDIVVQGLQRSDPASVFNGLPVKIGDSFTQAQTQDVAKTLLASGLYEKANVSLNGTVLSVELAERSVIADLTIKGMKNFDKKQVASGLKENGFAQGYPFDPELLEKVKEELKFMYDEAGLVGAKITSDVKQQDRKQVSVTVNVDEGAYLKVKKIVIDGNTKVSDRKIRSIMELNTNGIFSWYSKDSRFAPERLKNDLELIRNYYLDKGYLDFELVNVDTPSSADGKGIELHLAFKEGERYKVNSLALEGVTKDTPRADLEKLMRYKIGSEYSREAMAKIAQEMSARFGDDGYALAKVSVVPKLNKQEHLADVVFSVDPLERTYVRHIEINGNSRTKDDVIRRESRQMESALYSGANIQLTRDRIDRLGYFSEVVAETIPVAGVNNQVDVNYRVKETPTGDLKLGLGYSSSDKLGLSGSINERNFLGSGQSLGVAIDTSKSTRNFSVSTSNPYFTKSGVSSDLSAYYRTYDASELDVSETKYTTMGLNATFGVPISERHKLFFGINPEINEIELSADSPNSYTQYIEQFGTNRIKTIETSVGWSYDTRNSTYLPTKGLYQRALIAASLFGTARYVRGTYQIQQFTPLSKYVTLALNSQIDYGTGLNGQDFPFFKNLYAGGIGSVRGYDSSSLGPTSLNTKNEVSYLGGSKRLIVNAELQFPFPGLTKNRDVRMFVFGDAGGLWSDSAPVYNFQNTPDNTCDFSKISFSGCSGLRYSYGLGLTWNSPIGPLKFSYARPIGAKDREKIQRFQFQIGTGF